MAATADRHIIHVYNMIQLSTYVNQTHLKFFVRKQLNQV